MMPASRDTRLAFKRLTKAERDRVREHFLRLDAEDRRLRFCGPAGDDFVWKYCARLNRSGSVVIGCFVDGFLRGVGELRVDRGASSRTAEIAASVEKPYQDRGIGTELFRRLTDMARERSIDAVYVITLSENEKALRIAHKFGVRLVFQGGTAEGRIAGFAARG